MKSFFYILSRVSAKERIIILICFLLTCLQAYFEIQIPYCMAMITKEALKQGCTISDVSHNCVSMLLYSICAALIRVVIGWLSTIAGIALARRLSVDLYNKVIEYSPADMDHFSVSSIITRLTSDVEQIRIVYILIITSLFKAPIVAALGLWRISGSVIWWTASMWIAIIIVCVTLFLTLMYTTPKYASIQKLNDKINRDVHEAIEGAAYIRSYNAFDYQNEKFSADNNKITDDYLKVNRIMQPLTPALTFLMNLLSLIIYFTGAYVINNSSFERKRELFSEMIAFSSYSSQIIIGFLLMVLVLMAFPKAFVSCNRIVDVLTYDLSIKNGTIVRRPESGEIIFENVSFRYPGMNRDILRGLSFSVKKGQTIGIIGPTGSGKTTLLNLMMRFYDTTYGNIYIDGTDITKYDLNALHSCFGYVTQKPMILSGSIRDNILYGEYSLNENEMIKAAEDAQISDFIEASSNKYDSEVKQAGNNLSGGQKQRIAIARALQRNPKILVLDDSFSALDYMTERKISDVISEYKDMTKVIVSQKITSIMNADVILLLEDGKCMGIGKHDELMLSSELYKQMAESQYIGGGSDAQ